MNTNVFWYETKKSSTARVLADDLACDVVIVGGGMAGLVAAYTLHEAGKNVVVLEREFCGAGASGKSSGFITPASEIELSALVDMYGETKAPDLWEFVVGGCERIRTIAAQEHIDCDMVAQDSLFLANDKDGLARIESEVVMRKKLGYGATTYTEQTLAQVVGAEGYLGAVRYPNTFAINSYKFCQGLKDVLLAKGVAIYEGTVVTSVEQGQVLVVGGHAVKAKQVLVATDRFAPELGLLADKMYHVQTFLAITAPLTAHDQKKIFPSGSMLTWDSDLTYQYFRLTSDGRLLVGGADLLAAYAKKEKTDLTKIQQHLSSYIQQHFSRISTSFTHVWPGMLGVTQDLLPLVGENTAKPGVWMIGAASGLPWAAALATYVAGRMTGKPKTAVEDDFSPERKFLVHPRIQHLIGKGATYAVANAHAEYGSDVVGLVHDVAKDIKKSF